MFFRFKNPAWWVEKPFWKGYNLLVPEFPLFARRERGSRIAHMRI